MTFPSITFCDLQAENKVQVMPLYCYFGSDFTDCLNDNVTIYFDQIKKDCLRLNFGSNATIPQKTEREGIEYGYEIRLYIPNYAVELSLR